MHGQEQQSTAGSGRRAASRTGARRESRTARWAETLRRFLDVFWNGRRRCRGRLAVEKQKKQQQKKKKDAIQGGDS